MSITEASGSKSPPESEAQPQPALQPQSQPAESAREREAGQNAADESPKGANRLAEHKGKLAMGAAAMLGIAVFYKWRDSKLAKDDPEEYARLRRLKAAVESEESKSHKKR